MLSELSGTPLRKGVQNGIGDIFVGKTMNLFKSDDARRLFDDIHKQDDDNDPEKLWSCCEKIATNIMVQCAFGKCHLRWLHKSCAGITKRNKEEFWYCIHHRNQNHKFAVSHVKMRNYSFRERN